MSTEKFTALDSDLYAYLLAHGAREDGVLRRVREQAEAMGDAARMQVAPDQGALLTMLARLIGTRRAIEVGTFTGYSAICLARGLTVDGRLVALELDPERAKIARDNFVEAEVDGLIELRVGPASETLAAIAGGGVEPFDLAFIDADKTGYRDYLESCYRLLRTGGLIVVDNVLWEGDVVDPDPDEPDTVAIDQLNRELATDERFDLAMVPIADGITLLRKR